MEEPHEVVSSGDRGIHDSGFVANLSAYCIRRLDVLALEVPSGGWPGYDPDKLAR